VRIFNNFFQIAPKRNELQYKIPFKRKLEISPPIDSFDRLDSIHDITQKQEIDKNKKYLTNLPFPAKAIGLYPTLLKEIDCDAASKLIIDTENIELRLTELAPDIDSNFIKSDLMKYLKDPLSLSFGIKNKEGDIVGVGSMHKAKNNNTGFISAIYIDKMYRGKGIGAWMLNNFIDKAKNEGFESINLNTARLKAKELYERMGFKVIIEAKNPAGLPHWLMQYDVHQGVHP